MTEFIFPQPTGQHAVGTKLFELTDQTRNDPETSKPRELVMQVWYPSLEKPGQSTAPYAYEVLEWYKRSLVQQGVAEEKIHMLDCIRTQAITDAHAYAQDAPYPVIIFGHGNGAPRGAYSFLCEEIASHGYVVAMVMHTYVTGLIRFADGRTIDEMRDPRACAVIETCFADIEFMLNQAVAGSFGSLTTLCDFNNIGMVGHSLGGIMTAQTCRRDKRIKMGISLDAPLWGINATKPFHKPFLFIRTSNFYEDMSGVLDYQKDLLQAVGVTKDNFNGSIERFCKENVKDTMQIVVEGATHMTFMDDPIIQNVIAKIIGSPPGIHTLEHSEVLPVPKILDAIKCCIMTFLNRQLKRQEAAFPSVVKHKAALEDFDFYIPDNHQKHIKVEIDPLLLDEYIGQYKCVEMIFTIFKGGNNLYAQISGQPYYPIYPESEITFFFTAADMQLSFVKDKNGKITHLTWHQGALDFIAEKI